MKNLKSNHKTKSMLNSTNSHKGQRNRKNCLLYVVSVLGLLVLITTIIVAQVIPVIC